MPCRFKAGLRWILRVSHDQNFKNLILDYPRAALEFFAFEEAATIPATARITPVRQEQLQDRLGEHFRELDTPLLVEFPEGEREAVLFLLEEETTTQQFSIHRLARYCLDIAELLNTERVVPVVIFLRPGRYPRSLDLGTTRNTYLSFWFIISDLGTIPAREYLHSRNIVARMNLPNMRQDPEQRVEIYLRAQEGLAQLEPDPNKRIKYIDFIARYANLTEEEQAQYKQYLQQSSYKEVIMGPVQQAREEGIQQGFQDGIQRGIQLGVELKFGREGLALMPDIRRIQDIEVLNTIHNGLKSVDSIHQLQRMYRDYLDKD
uniref:Transposase, YhgA-like n=1 Tax=Candidatus Kentrum sp. LFY TaxID=2126342 RepID=A0A450UWZ2_9GAMM|nr:MAG: Putative transposase, YhgA-like [Candidatus Kentron sp. LFY]